MPRLIFGRRGLERAPTCQSARVADTDRIACHFDRRAIRRDVSQLPDPVPISARLQDLLSDVADVRPSVLDLGCGDGSGGMRLLQRGARYVTGIDLSPASIEIARCRALGSGLESDRARFLVGDVASLSLARHDWVLLDRVICCYGDPDRLVGNALTAAKRRIAFSVPESRGWRRLLNAIGWSAENLLSAIVRPGRCRGYVHDVETIERHLEAAGFRKLRSGHRGLWYAAVFDCGASPTKDPSSDEARERRG